MNQSTKFHVETFEVNMVLENTYILSDNEGNAIMIDCGALYEKEKETIANYVADNHLKICRLLCTHGHFDHLFGATWASKVFGVDVEISDKELETYESCATLMQQVLHRIPYAFTIPKAKLFSFDDIIEVGQIKLRVIGCPGHTPGGVCFYEENQKIIFSGDSLFEGSIGRCDLPGGSQQQLLQHLKNNILILPNDVTVYPGHGYTTTIGMELAHNPYI